MRTEDLFKYGVTPKEGPFAGKKFNVTSITPAAVKVTLYDGDKAMDDEFTHGSYDIWQAPKTLFEDRSIEPTWGNLKKAMEAAGLDDDTLFVVPRTDWFTRGYGEPAEFSIEMLRQPYERAKKHVVVR